MANQSPEEIHVKHIRAPDYREIPADGTLHKIVDNHLVITFYIEDSRVTAEVLKRDGEDSPNLRIAAIQEERQRLDVMAVRISDQGIGIASADVPHVFDPFRRTAGALKTNAQGVGLGLYIVREFVGLLGGTIDVQSALGSGSTFTVRLPRRLGRAANTVAPA